LSAYAISDGKIFFVAEVAALSGLAIVAISINIARP
jgi:hypothetical protein